jgi:hypothetical protein
MYIAVHGWSLKNTYNTFGTNIFALSKKRKEKTNDPSSKCMLKIEKTDDGSITKEQYPLLQLS